MQNRSAARLFAALSSVAFVVALGYAPVSLAHSGSVVEGTLTRLFGDPHPDLRQKGKAQQRLRHSAILVVDRVATEVRVVTALRAAVVFFRQRGFFLIACFLAKCFGQLFAERLDELLHHFFEPFPVAWL